MPSPRAFAAGRPIVRWCVFAAAAFLAIRAAIGRRRVKLEDMKAREAAADRAGARVQHIALYAGPLLGLCAVALPIVTVPATTVRSPASKSALEAVDRSIAPVPAVTLKIAVLTSSLLGMVGVLSGYFPAKDAASKEPAVAMKF